MKIDRAMIPASKCVVVSPRSTVFEAGQLMAKFHVGSVVISDNGRAVGLITKTDVIRSTFGLEQDPKTTLVGELATKRALVTIPSSKDVAQAAALIAENKIHHVVVTDEEGLFAGVISSWDIAREADLDNKAFPYSREALAML
eukprot:ANDGO_08157.mRNA.1 Uncharacterized protein MJ0653